MKLSHSFYSHALYTLLTTATCALTSGCEAEESGNVNVADASTTMDVLTNDSSSPKDASTSNDAANLRDAAADARLPDGSTPDVIVDAAPDVVAFLDAAVDAAPDGLAPPGTKRVFVTHGTYSADLEIAGGGFSGPNGADKICTQEAQTANLGGTWKAWISDTGYGSGASRVGVHGPWARLDGVMVFPGSSAVGLPVVPINVTSLSYKIPATAASSGSDYVFTNLTNDGTSPNLATDCEDWTTSSWQVNTNLGSCVSSTNWSASYFKQCDRLARLYCFEQ